MTRFRGCVCGRQKGKGANRPGTAEDRPVRRLWQDGGWIILVYRLATGDLDGDGKDEALVGVIRPTRFYPQPERRLFIFKQVNGKIRPMWMGSRLGGILCDFRFASPYVRTLQSTTDGKYVVADYTWDDFGLAFARFLTGAVSRKKAMEKFTFGSPEKGF